MPQVLVSPHISLVKAVFTILTHFLMMNLEQFMVLIIMAKQLVFILMLLRIAVFTIPEQESIPLLRRFNMNTQMTV